jgi:hypothetical protein
MARWRRLKAFHCCWCKQSGRMVCEIMQVLLSPPPAILNPSMPPQFSVKSELSLAAPTCAGQGCGTWGDGVEGGLAGPFIQYTRQDLTNQPS